MSVERGPAAYAGGAATLALGQRKRRAWWSEFLVRLFRDKPMGAVGLVIVIIMGLTAVFAPIIAPYGFHEQIHEDALQGYSWRHWLGTDNLGRDVLSRVMYGARISMQVGFFTVFLSLVGATFIALVSGYTGGVVDSVIQRVVDGWMVLPWLVMLLSIMAILGPGLYNIIIALSIDAAIWNSRVIYGEVLHVKENTYVEAARALGASPQRIMLFHILPNIMAPIIVVGSVSLGAFIVAEASISFLGFGIPPPNPSWGGMLSRTGAQFMAIAPWLAIWPGVALGIAVFSFNMLGDAMRDLLDPRLRGTM